MRLDSWEVLDFNIDIQSSGISCIMDLYMLLLLAVERFSFSLKDLGEIKPGFKTLQMSLSVLNPSEILLVATR